MFSSQLWSSTEYLIRNWNSWDTNKSSVLFLLYSQYAETYSRIKRVHFVRYAAFIEKYSSLDIIASAERGIQGNTESRTANLPFDAYKNQSQTASRTKELGFHHRQIHNKVCCVFVYGFHCLRRGLFLQKVIDTFYQPINCPFKTDIVNQDKCSFRPKRLSKDWHHFILF